MLLEKHQQSKSIILEKLEELAEIAQRIGMDELATDIRHQRIVKLRDEQFHLVVLGEFNHGKSTFVNAMLGSELLPTGITPTTSALNHVVYSESPRAKVLLSNGEETALSPSEIAEWVTVAGGHENVQRVEIGYPSEILKGNITLVDTPGVNDLNEQRADITYGYVPRADAVIFLLDASQALKDSEREFLSSHVLEGSKDRLIFVLGKIDLLSEAEQQAVLKYVRAGLKKFVDDPVVFPLSAKDWLDEKAPDSGFPELLTYLDRFLDTDRAQIVLDNAAVDASRTAALVQQNLGIKLHALGLDMGDLEHRVEEVKKQLDSSKRQIDELHLRIKAEVEAIKSHVSLSLNDFTQRFAQLIPHEIDRVDSGDLKQYLGPFVQDKFKEWAEHQGLHVSRALEKLAEEIITVTNENVADAFHSLSSRLGASQTEIDIDTDSFMYDLGIYAVGALGTTVFLFVNTLAGGLLTLAAPVLAIIVKSKVSGDIKEQAKERAPGVILKAGETMKPFFDECIDDFGMRLRNFVTTAGVNLYKGITEVLEKTVEERKEGADVIVSLVESTRADSLDIVHLRAALDKARDGIWDRPPEQESATSSDKVSAVSGQEEAREGKVQAVPPPPLPEDVHEDDIEEVEEDSFSPVSDESRKDLN